MHFLIETLLNVRALEHREVQEEIRRNLRGLGYYVKLEKKILTSREGEKPRKRYISGVGFSVLSPFSLIYELGLVRLRRKFEGV